MFLDLFKDSRALDSTAQWMQERVATMNRAVAEVMSLVDAAMSLERAVRSRHPIGPAAESIEDLAAGYDTAAEALTAAMERGDADGIIRIMRGL